MDDKLVAAQPAEGRDVAHHIRARVKKPLMFNQRDISEYRWVLTRYFYGSGFNLGLAVGESPLTGFKTVIPVLCRDFGTWHLPVYRHERRLHEFFIPGLTTEDVKDFLVGCRFYPLTAEEKIRAHEIVCENFNEQFEREIRCLTEYILASAENVDARAGIKGFRPKKIKVLFGTEIYRGENPKIFREKTKKAKYKPSISIYVWEHGIRSDLPKKIN